MGLSCPEYVPADPDVPRCESGRTIWKCFLRTSNTDVPIQNKRVECEHLDETEDLTAKGWPVPLNLKTHGKLNSLPWVFCHS